jgi:hypothetical protein
VTSIIEALREVLKVGNAPTFITDSELAMIKSSKVSPLELFIALPHRALWALVSMPMMHGRPLPEQKSMMSSKTLGMAGLVMSAYTEAKTISG